MKTPHRRLLAVVAVALVVTAAVGGWRLLARSPEPAPAADPAARREGLLELRNRLVPSGAGGWVVETPAAEPHLVVWLQAASQDRAPSQAFTDALRAARRSLEGLPRSATTPEGASLGLALAQVLPGPTADRSLADQLAGDVADRAALGLARGEATWLGPLLQLSGGGSPSAGEAQRTIESHAGGPDCDRLPTQADPLPPPSGVMTVALRTLAAADVRCPEAGVILDAALQDPAWDTWIASAELADLVTIAPDLAGGDRRTLAARLAGFVAVGPEEPIDLGSVVAVQAARRRLDLPLGLPAPLRWHLSGQVASRGGLPGRASLPPTAFDVAVQRQLAGEGLLASELLAQTVRVHRPAPTTEADVVDPVAERVLVGGAASDCEDAPARAPERARVTFDAVVADEAWAVVRAWCGGSLELDRTVRRLRSYAGDDLRVLRMAVAELTACQLDPDALRSVEGTAVELTGPFATDALLIWARSTAADPVAACAALRGT